MAVSPGTSDLDRDDTTVLTCAATREIIGIFPGSASPGPKMKIRCQLNGTEHDWHRAERRQEMRTREPEFQVVTTILETIEWRD
jgi:hypothetical protein